MKRQKLTDNPRRWFNGDNALRIPGTLEYDPASGTWLQRTTRDFYSREDLYYTASGRWILHRWSIRHGSPSQWVEITPGEAIQWLERSGYAEEAERFRRKLRRLS